MEFSRPVEPTSGAEMGGLAGAASHLDYGAMLMADPDSVSRNRHAPTFMTLPLEIRNQIYTHRIACDGSPDLQHADHVGIHPRYAFFSRSRPENNAPSMVRHTESHPVFYPMCRLERINDTRRSCNSRAPLNLFLVSWPVYREVRQIFWSLFRFAFFDADEASRFLEMGTRKFQGSIKHLILHLNVCPGPADPLWPYFGSPPLTPSQAQRALEERVFQMEIIRADLPFLQTVEFRFADPFWPSFTHFRAKIIENLLTQMMPFQDVNEFYVEYKDGGSHPQGTHGLQLDSRLVRIENLLQGRLSSSVPEDRQNEVIWIRSTAAALKKTYVDTQPRRRNAWNCVSEWDLDKFNLKQGSTHCLTCYLLARHLSSNPSSGVLRHLARQKHGCDCDPDIDP